MSARKTLCHFWCVAISLPLLTGCCLIPSPSDFYVSPAGDNATGDGSSAHPWKTIQYALDHLPYESSWTHNLHVAAGTYDEKITISHAVTILGAGADVVTIKNTSDNDYVITITIGLVTIRGLKVDCRMAANPGIRATGGLPILIRINVSQPGGRSILVQDCLGFEIADCTIGTDWLLYSDIGIDISNDPSRMVLAGTISNLSAGDYIDHIINIGRNCDVTIRDSELRGSTIWYADGVRIQGASNVSIINTQIIRPEDSESPPPGAAHNPPYAGVEVATVTNDNRLITIDNCTIRGFDVGIGINMMYNRLLARNNTITGNVRAAVDTVYHGSDASMYPVIDLGGGTLGSVGNNTFGASATWGVYHTGPYNLAAFSNHWSVAPGSIPGRIHDHADDPSVGTVLY